MRSLIINAPDLQTMRQRFVSSFFTFLFWAIWMYLWLPLVSLVAWLVGIDLFYQQMIVQSGYQSVAALIGWFVLAVLFMAVTLLGWAGYNLLLFRGKGRRKNIKAVEAVEMANRFQVNVFQLKEWRRSKWLTIHHDDHCKIDHIDKQRKQPAAGLKSSA